MAKLSMCRLCMCSERLVDLYEVDSDITLHIKISSCLSIKILPDDGLPPVICTTCKMHIKMFYEFKMRCLEVDSQLKAIINKELINKTNNISQIKTDVKMECDFTKNNNFNYEELDNWMFYGEPNIDDKESKSTAVKETEFEGINYLGKVIYDKNIKFSKLKTEKCVMDTYQCEFCGFVVNTKVAFHRHMKSHNSTKRFSCDLCPTKFTRAAQKAIHIRSHMGIRPFVCDVCGQATAKKQDLIRHMTVHSEVRNYSCTRCDRRFKRSYDVHSHMQSHTGARPYSCSICGREYTSHSSLRKHENKYCKSNDKNK